MLLLQAYEDYSVAVDAVVSSSSSSSSGGGGSSSSSSMSRRSIDAVVAEIEVEGELGAVRNIAITTIHGQ